MTEFVARYGMEAKYRKAPYHARWPKRSRCPACGDRRRLRFRRERQTYLRVLGVRASDHAAQRHALGSTDLPLTKWFPATHLLTSMNTNMAAWKLMRHLDVCYRTAWRLK